MASTVAIEPVLEPEVGGARLRRHVLDREAARLMQLCKRIGQRLNRWFRDMPEQQAAQYTIRGEPGEPPTVQLRRDAEGNVIMEPVVPTPDMMETFRWYQTALLGLLKEQRMRAAMKTGRPELSDEEAEAELRDLVADTVRTMPKAELERLLGERGAIDVSPAVRAASQVDEAREVAPRPEQPAPSDPLDFGGGDGG